MPLTTINTDNASDRKFLLVVDSNKTSSSGVKAVLKQFQYKVWSVSTAAEAFELCDIVMPALIIVRKVEDMEQVAFVKELKRRDTSGQLAIVVATSVKDADLERSCLAAGAVTCLKLPLSIETLYRTVQVAIESVPRMNIRINTSLPVIIEDKTVHCSEGRLASALSENGLYVVTPDPCPLKTKIPIRFRLGRKIVSADAVVIYAHKQGNRTNYKPGMGLQFVRISDQDQEQIRLYIREEVKKGILASTA